MDNSNLKELIELFNNGYWEKNVKPYFKKVRTFLKYVAVKGLSEEISVEILDNEDYNEGPNFFEFLILRVFEYLCSTFVLLKCVYYSRILII